jgi:hypothetical protein
LSSRIEAENPMAKRASNIVQVKVRMKAAMQRILEREADKRGQTVNAEILRRLERSLDEERISAVIRARMDAIEALVTKTTSETVGTLASTLGMDPAKLQLQVLRDRLQRRDFESRVDAIRDAEEAMIKFVITQNPSIDEHTARKHVDALIEKTRYRPTETPDQIRASKLGLLIYFLLRTGRIPGYPLADSDEQRE